MGVAEQDMTGVTLPSALTTLCVTLGLALTHTSVCAEENTYDAEESSEMLPTLWLDQPTQMKSMKRDSNHHVRVMRSDSDHHVRVMRNTEKLHERKKSFMAPNRILLLHILPENDKGDINQPEDDDASNLNFDEMKEKLLERFGYGSGPILTEKKREESSPHVRVMRNAEIPNQGVRIMKRKDESGHHVRVMRSDDASPHVRVMRSEDASPHVRVMRSDEASPHVRVMRSEDASPHVRVMRNSHLRVMKRDGESPHVRVMRSYGNEYSHIKSIGNEDASSYIMVVRNVEDDDRHLRMMREYNDEALSHLRVRRNDEDASPHVRIM